MNRRHIEYDSMKRASIDLVVEQLRIRGECAKLADKRERHDVLIEDKDIRIKVKFGKPIKRSRCGNGHWEFTKVVHSSRLWPSDLFDYYVLVGFDEHGSVKKIWKLSSGDSLIYRKNQVFIPANDDSPYKRYELDIMDIDNKEFRWID